MQRWTQKPSPWNYGDSTKRPKNVDQLARSSKNPDLQKRAAALLGSPEYNLLGSFQDARNDRRWNP
jgi:hypothetical protein